ncbi:MAG: sugar ABC transporter permease [Deltaproteobacteria bacterium]|nr:sugar ABC transporter permease [Deltaproteobacteria bacterium]
MKLRLSIKAQRTAFIILFLLPAFAFLGMFLYYPIEETFRISLMRSTGLGNDQFIGLKNYIRLFSNEEFRAGLWHVLVWAFWSIVIQIPLAFIVAFSLTFYKNKLTGPLRAIYYLANVLPSAIVAMLGQFVFAPNYGIINRIAEVLHIPWIMEIDFFGNPSIAFWTVFTVATWTYTGFPIVFLMARIEQIPREIRDAAELDGVTGWTYARYIVIPSLSYPLRILAVLCTVGSLKLFDLPYLLTRGGPGHATVTLGITLYRDGFINWQYGKAAAIGVVIFILSLGFTILQFSWGKSRKEES